MPQPEYIPRIGLIKLSLQGVTLVQLRVTRHAAQHLSRALRAAREQFSDEDIADLLIATLRQETEE